jgi:hypothetical protein
VPTVAGGLCQLSNALYDAALKANFIIIERHKHTKVIKGSLAEQDRDATVKWNYIDLRFQSNFDFRIEVELTSNKLMVTFKSIHESINLGADQVNLRTSNKLNDCYSCGNITCFKHGAENSSNAQAGISTYILDERWPEFDQYIQSIATKDDYFIVPLKKSRFLQTDRYQWSSLISATTKATTWHGIYRAVKLRYSSKNKTNIFELSLKLDQKIAKAAAKLIPIHCTHLVISQNLLPFIYDTGALGGRTYDVLMTRLPMEKLHERLDFAHVIHPESSTLNDFRATPRLLELENIALTKSRKIITAHAEIAAIFKHKVEKLSWQIPPIIKPTVTGHKILFPAASLGRKGVYEICKLAKELQLSLTVTGGTTENDHIWNGVNVEKFDGNYDQIGLILYPTYIEHQPRQVLKAISKGIPVITTTACGIESSSQVSVLPLNDFEQLKSEVTAYLK